MDYTKYYEGKYEVQVTGQGVGKSKTNNPYFMLHIQPLRFFGLVGEEDCSGGDPQKFYMTITEKTVDARMRDLESIGYTRGTFSGLDPEREGFHDFTGVKFIARNKHSERNGNKNDQWEVEFNGSANAIPLDQSDVSALDRLFASKKAPPKKAAPAASQKNRPLSKVGADDNLKTDAECPF